jgi:hypothetical protein
MIVPVWIIRKITPKTHVVVPVRVIELLVDAADRGYLPAFGGSEEALADARHAARAARNIVRRAAVEN